MSTGGADAGGGLAEAGAGLDADSRDGGAPIDTGAGPEDATARTDDAGPESPGTDCFGVRNIYATAAGGRQWCLPDMPAEADDEWEPDDDFSATSEPGVLHSAGSPRHSVGSPEGRAWWRNIEMSVYVRWIDGADDEFTLYARGERHTDGLVDPDDINEGIAAPDGTATWPGYPFGAPVPHPCLGTAYKGSVATDGSAFYKKEISHTAGYTSSAGEVRVFEGGLPSGEWIGIKFVIRNIEGDTAVRLETWIDRDASDTWEMVTSYEDRGGWEGSPADDGCDDAPLEYTDDQILTWAGPIAVLRADDQQFDFRWFSIREIAPGG